jgi:photosystem II stability/assembly factor-like uncharacterized protein
MRSRPFVVLVGLAVALAVGCNKKSGGSSNNNGGGGAPNAPAWLVGQQGLMLAVDHKDPEDVSPYDLSSLGLGRPMPDLLAITCRGGREAWVAGARGTILRTGDAGDTWRKVPSDTTANLRAIAVGQEGAVMVAGDAGALLVSPDGLSWRTIAAPPVTFNAIATTAFADIALLAGADGAIYRLETRSGELLRVTEPGHTLRAVAITADGARAVATGEGGTFLLSDDGGRTFRPRPLGTTRALHDVWLTQTGGRAIAVGESGVILDVDLSNETLPLAQERMPGALRSLHLSVDGSGLTVGDGGAAFITTDGGHTWRPLSLGTRSVLYGVDALHGEPHL